MSDGENAGGEKRRTQSEFDRQIWEMVLGPRLSTGNHKTGELHHTESMDCWCKPTMEILDEGDLLVIHNRGVKK